MGGSGYILVGGGYILAGGGSWWVVLGRAR